MAIIFSLFAQCADAAAVERFCAHFQGLRWTLTDGTESTLEAGPYSAVIPSAAAEYAAYGWVTPTGVSDYGARDDREAIQLTELGERLCEHLRSAPPFELAMVGIEVDHSRGEAELDEMIRDGWPGLVFSGELFQRAGSPPACVPFRDGMWWHPYIGEWRPPSRRHLPDLEVVTCLGCDRRIRAHELVRLEDHGHSSCCVWHPYHLWCIRDAPPPARPITECADCVAAIDLDQLRGTIAWGAAAPHHLHARAIAVEPPYSIFERVDGYAGKPPGVSRRAIAVEAASSASGHELHELVHDACPTDDPWRSRLRSAPGDDELRRVYADHLEQVGDLGRANLVRALIAVPDEPAARSEAERLRRAIAGVPLDWLRDVCRR